MNKEIIKYPNPILRKKSEAVREITLEIKELAFDVAETMQKNQGLGLAAPQISVPKRIIAIKTGDSPTILINPKIIKKSKEEEMAEEGCLSFPELFLKIKRAKEIEIEAIDLKGEKLEIEAEDLLARALQHEIDHLEGVLFIDRLNFWQRLKFKLKL